MDNPLDQHLSHYQIKFPTTEADCKKALAMHKRLYGASHYSNPVLANFKESLDSCVMSVIIKSNHKGSTWKVRELQRELPVDGKPKPDVLEFHIEKLSAMFNLTRDDAVYLIVEGENRLHDAIGQALCKL